MRRLRILIVDDSVDSADALAELLQVEHEVRLARDGAEGLDLATRWRPELVFMDLSLPGIDGCEVARQLRASGLPARLIALTGYALERDRDRTTAAGFDLHLVKPLAIEQIVEVVDAEACSRAG